MKTVYQTVNLKTKERTYVNFDNFLSQHMNRVPLAVFIIEDNSKYDINPGTAEKF